MAFAGLLAIAVATSLAAWFRCSPETHRIPGRRVWRSLAWVGGPLLIVYGTVNATAAVAILAGWVETEISDRPGVIGHAFVWDPLFASWGAP